MTIPENCEEIYELEVGDLVTPRFEPFAAMGIVTGFKKRNFNPCTNKVFVCWYHNTVFDKRRAYTHEEFTSALFRVSK